MNEEPVNWSSRFPRPNMYVEVMFKNCMKWAEYLFQGVYYWEGNLGDVPVLQGNFILVIEVLIKFK